MCRGPAGAAGGRGPERPRATRTERLRFHREGPTHQSDARDLEPLVSVDVARAGYYFNHPLLLFNLRLAMYLLGAARLMLALILLR